MRKQRNRFNAWIGKLALLAITIVATVFSLVACKKDEDEKTMRFTQAAVTVGIDLEVALSLEGEWENVTYASANESIATVSAEGKVKGVAEGETTVTATSGDYSATCTVTVVEIVGDRAASISLNTAAVDLFVGDEFTLVPTLKLGADEVKDPQFSWSTANAAVATVENGVVKAVAKGQTVITVASTRYENTDKEIAVTVNNDYTLDFSQSGLTLGMVSIFGYENTAEIAYTAKVNGAVENAPEVAYASSNEDVVTVSQENGKLELTANAVGQTTLSLQWTKDGDTVTSRIDVAVCAPRTTTETYDYSVSKQTIDLAYVESEMLPADLTVSEVAEVTDELGASYSIAGRSGKVLTLSGTETLGTAGVAKTFTLDYGDFIVDIPVKCYTLAIRTVEEFNSLKDYIVEYPNPNTDQGGMAKAVLGDFVLSADLDFEGGIFKTFCGKNQTGAAGYFGWCASFDGQGHTVKNLVLAADSHTGVFGCIGFYGSVKNVAFVDCVNMGRGGFFADYIYTQVGVENVFVSATQTSGQDGGSSCLLSQTIDKAYAKVKNVTLVALNPLVGNSYAIAESFHFDSIDDSLVTIGASDTQQYRHAVSETTENGFIHTYANAKAASMAQLPQNGSTTYSVNGDYFEISFNGKLVYKRLMPTQALEAYDYSLGKKSVDFSLVGGIDASNISSIKDELGNDVEWSRTGQVVTFANHATLNAAPSTATGAVTYLQITASGNEYVLPLNVYSLAIRTVADFNSLHTYVDINTDYSADGKGDPSVRGYFVLCNDLDFEGGEFEVFCSSAEIGSGGHYGWSAIFDGRNHTISNMKLVQNYWHYINRAEVNKIADTDARKAQGGVFGLIGWTGIVKDVAFVNCINATKGGFFADYIYADNNIGVQNVYISATQSYDAAALLSKNISVNYADISDVTAVLLNGIGYTITTNTANGKGLACFRTPCVSIGATDRQVVAGYCFIDGTAMNNITNYSTAQVASAASLNGVGSVSYALEGESFQIKWCGAVIYTATLAAE
ncbi:MAG: Ig-like domain-containing protein [Clostridia bacterium]|nr:Ig-like domain-containing protein [Clostridia bacterium]